MAEDVRPTNAARPPYRLFGALGLPAFALGLLLSWALLAGPDRRDFVVLPVLVLLALGAPRWPGAHPRMERALRAGTGLAAALILALTVLRQHRSADAALTVPLFLLLIGGATLALHLALPPRPALGALLSALAALAGLGLARGADAGEALGRALLTATPWALLGIALVGIGALARVERRWLQVPMYALAVAGLAAYWQWGGPLADLGAIRGGITPLERRAAGLLPAFILIGGGAQLLVAALLPRVPWRRTAQADLAASLPLLGLPIVAETLPLRLRSPLEDAYGIAWLAWFPIAYLALRLIIGLAFLLRAATAPPAGADATPRWREARLALAFFVLCTATYWPATIWRMDSLGLVGDEPQYYAATISLWRDRNLDIANTIYSPEISAVMAYPDQERDLHAYEDATADRLLFSRSFGPARGTFFLPLVAAPDLTSTIALFNAGLESAGGEVVFRDPGGAVVQKVPVVVEPGRSLTVQPPPRPGAPLSATINVGKPITAAARVQAADGSFETAYGTVVTARHCLPYQLEAGRWRARIVVQNGLPAADEVAWTRYGPDGAVAERGTLPLPADGTADLPVPTGEAGTVCLTAGAAVAAMLVGRASPGLLIQQSNPAQVASIALPARHTTLGYFGERLALIHNPSGDPITLQLARPPGTPGQELVVGPHATVAVADNQGAATITSEDPVIVGVIEAIGQNAAAVSPGQEPAAALVIPVIDVGREHYATSQLELTNRGTGDIQANAILLDDKGRTIWRNNLWVPAGTTLAFPFYYKAADSRALAISANGPLTASLLQHEMTSTRPSHGLGLSLALLPGYALGGFQGTLAVVALIAGLLALACYDLLRRIGLDARAAIVVAAVVACSSPLAPAAVRLYAEVGGTLLIVLALCCVDNWRIGRWPVLVAGPLCLICLGGALLFHGRLLPLALIIVASAGCLVLDRPLRGVAGWSWRTWAAYGAIALGAGLFLSVLLAISVRIEPRLSPTFLRNFLDTGRIGPQALGILFDRASGLFPAAPVLLLAGGGFVAAIRRAPYLGCTALALCVAQLGVIILRDGGWETWGPPGRYILPAVPFWAVGLGAAWCWGFARPVRWLAIALAALGACLAAFSWWLPIGLHYGVAYPQGFWFADDTLPPLLGANPLRAFPFLSSISDVAPRDILPWLALLAACTLLGLPWQRLRRGRAGGEGGEQGPGAAAASPR